MKENNTPIKDINKLYQAAAPPLQNAVENALHVASKPLRGAVLSRVLSDIVVVVQESEKRFLDRAASYSSGIDVFLSLLEESEYVRKSLASDPLGLSRVRGLRMKHEMLKEEGGVVSSSQASELLGITRQAVEKRRKQGRLLAVSLARRGYYYPLWQFGEKGIIEGFEAVMKILTEQDPWMIMIFFLNENSRLGKRKPLDEIRLGHLGAVLRAAEATREQGAY